MPRHKKGTLVRAKTKEEIGEDWDVFDSEDTIVPNGYLYIVERFLPKEHPHNEYGHDAYECRSIQTGAVIQLFLSEITTRKSKETNHE